MEPIGLRHAPGYAMLLMKLMGMAKLHQLAQSGTADLAGAIAALCVELREGEFDCAEALLEMYPTAKVEGATAEIALDADHCVILQVHYEGGYVLVKGAGLRGTRPEGGGRR